MAKSRLELDMDQVVTDLALAGVTTPHVFGSKYLAAHSSPPRVVWERGRASFQSPAIATNGNPRRLVVMAQSVMIHLWAADEGALQVLLENEIVALKRRFSGTYSVDSFEPGAVNEEWIRLGVAGVLNCTLQHAVVDEIVPVGKVEAIAQSEAEISSAWMDSGGMLAE
jgi:hypothetical protein